MANDEEQRAEAYRAATRRRAAYRKTAAALLRSTQPDKAAAVRKAWEPARRQR